MQLFKSDITSRLIAAADRYDALRVLIEECGNSYLTRHAKIKKAYGPFPVCIGGDPNEVELIDQKEAQRTLGARRGLVDEL